jgi:hypothetical protein
MNLPEFDVLELPRLKRIILVVDNSIYAGAFRPSNMENLTYWQATKRAFERYAKQVLGSDELTSVERYMVTEVQEHGHVGDHYQWRIECIRTEDHQ